MPRCRPPVPALGKMALEHRVKEPRDKEARALEALEALEVAPMAPEEQFTCLACSPSTLHPTITHIQVILLATSHHQVWSCY